MIGVECIFVLLTSKYTLCARVCACVCGGGVNSLSRGYLGPWVLLLVCVYIYIYKRGNNCRPTQWCVAV